MVSNYHLEISIYNRRNSSWQKILPMQFVKANREFILGDSYFCENYCLIVST